MTDKDTSKLKTIDALIEREEPFAVFRLPEEKVPRLLTLERGTVRLIYDLKDLNGEKGFVIAPFRLC